MSNFKGPRRVSWQRISLSILCVILALVLFVMLFATAYVHHFLDLLIGDDNDSINATLSSEQLATATEGQWDTSFTGPSVGYEDVIQNTVPNEVQSVDGIINILLVGEDRRPGQGRQRSDSMILCSFNTKSNTITMISFLRDTYIAEIPGYWPEKLNAAYCFGGAKTLNQTLAAYFGVHVDANIAVQFDGFRSIIDMLGGVDIELTKKEVNHLNSENGWNLVAGVNHLDGEKALAYSRIRKIDMDTMRAQRQRNVLTALINAYKSKSVTEMLSLATKILEADFIDTDMSSSKVLSYVKSLFPMLATATINSQQIPATGTYSNMNVGKVRDTLVCDMVVNRKILQNILNPQ